MSPRKRDRWQRPPFYGRWEMMRQRCNSPTNKRFNYYGGRGISIDPIWGDFKAFQKWCFETYIPGCSIDRIDNDGPYAPWNCRWATPKEQNANRRITKTVKTRTEKICPKCSKKKPLDGFPKNKARYDGLHVYCFTCQKAHSRAMYLKHRSPKSLLLNGSERNKSL